MLKKYLKHIPNFSEIKKTLFLKSVLETIFGIIKNKLGDNPAANSVTKDIVMILPIKDLAESKQALGSTELIYDEGSVISISIRAGCKASFITAAYLNNFTTNSTDELALSSKISNIPCEVLSRIPVISSKFLQKELQRSGDINYQEFISLTQQNWKNEWIYESIGGGVIKSIISNKLNGITKYIGYAQKIKQYSNHFDESLVNSITENNNISFSKHNTAWDRIITNHNSTNNNMAYAIDGLIIVNSICTKFSIDLINNYALSPILRPIQDYSEVLIGSYGLIKFTAGFSAIAGGVFIAKEYLYPYIYDSIFYNSESEQFLGNNNSLIHDL